MLESSGGINTDHEEITSGIHKGDSAYGSYGLMPNTIQELINRSKNENRQLDPDYGNLYKKDPEYVKQVLSEQPELEERLARELALKVLQRSDNDLEKAAYGWKMGHNQDLKNIPSKKLDSNEYIRRFRSLRDKLGVR